MNRSYRITSNGQDNGALHVTFDQDDLLNVNPESDYQAVATLMVEPV